MASTWLGARRVTSCLVAEYNVEINSQMKTLGFIMVFRILIDSPPPPPALQRLCIAGWLPTLPLKNKSEKPNKGGVCHV